MGVLTAEMRAAISHICYTADMWSDPNLIGYLAITAHYYIQDENGRWKKCSRLVAFRHVQGKHSGTNMASYFFRVLGELRIMHKIGMITLDNAFNNGTMMRELEKLLQEHNIPFDAEGNRIHCFPHVINIAVKSGLSLLTKMPKKKKTKDSERTGWESEDEDDDEGSTADGCGGEFSSDWLYNAALEADPIARCRKLVSNCRASGQRREDLQATITDANKAGLFGKDDKGISIQLPSLQLLRDVDTRWSSIYLMLERVLDLYPAIYLFLNKKEHSEIAKSALDPKEREVLGDICEFLAMPHAAQELLSGEYTPTLCQVIPVYEELLQSLRELRLEKIDQDKPQIGQAIAASIKKIEDYVSKARKNRTYAIAMIINPACKLSWMEKHWSVQEVKNAKEWTIQTMLEHRIAHRRATSPKQSTDAVSTSWPVSATASGNGAQSIHRGISKLRALRQATAKSAARRTGLPSSTESDSQHSRSSTPVPPIEPAISEEEKERVERAKDLVIVTDEFERYIRTGVLQGDEADNLDLDLHWESHQYQLPYLCRTALDILPAQASSVSSERVFSSSKETCTLRRNKIAPVFLEVLQVLKYIYRQERLDFSSHLGNATEAELKWIPSAGVGDIRKALERGGIDELVEILNSAVPTVTAESSDPISSSSSS